MTPEEETEGPSFPRPWYYRAEYMIPMLVFWPAGALLVLRSPWNNNVILGGVAWALIIVGAVLGFRWLMDENLQPIMTFYVPGFLLTIVTQVQWTAYRHKMTSGDRASENASVDEVSEQIRAPRPSARRRRKNPRTHRSKS